MKTKVAAIQIVFFTLLLILVSSCKEEDKLSQLLGHWQLQEASRGTQVIQTLQGTYFKFTEDGMLESNLPYDPSIEMPFKVPVEFKENTFFSPKMEGVVFTMEKFEENTLRLSCTLQNIPFYMTLTRE